MSVVIDKVGWYLISTNTSKSIIDTVNSLKARPQDVLVLHEVAFYYDQAWPKNNTFSNDDWLTISTSNTMNPY